MPVTLSPIAGPVTVSAGAQTLGISHRALDLVEGGRPAVIYVPRADIDMTALQPTDRRTTCPLKGVASYFSIRTPGGVLENAVWSYEHPPADLAGIAGHLAFYTDRVTVRRG